MEDLNGGVTPSHHHAQYPSIHCEMQRLRAQSSSLLAWRVLILICLLQATGADVNTRNFSSPTPELVNMCIELLRGLHFPPLSTPPAPDTPSSTSVEPRDVTSESTPLTVSTGEEISTITPEFNISSSVPTPASPTPYSTPADTHPTIQNTSSSPAPINASTPLISTPENSTITNPSFNSSSLSSSTPNSLDISTPNSLDSPTPNPIDPSTPTIPHWSTPDTTLTSESYPIAQNNSTDGLFLTTFSSFSEISISSTSNSLTTTEKSYTTTSGSNNASTEPTENLVTLSPDMITITPGQNITASDDVAKNSTSPSTVDSTVKVTVTPGGANTTNMELYSGNTTTDPTSFSQTLELFTNITILDRISDPSKSDENHSESTSSISITSDTHQFTENHSQSTLSTASVPPLNLEETTENIFTNETSMSSRGTPFPSTQSTENLTLPISTTSLPDMQETNKIYMENETTLNLSSTSMTRNSTLTSTTFSLNTEEPVNSTKNHGEVSSMGVTVNPTSDLDRVTISTSDPTFSSKTKETTISTQKLSSVTQYPTSDVDTSTSSHHTIFSNTKVSVTKEHELIDNSTPSSIDEKHQTMDTSTTSPNSHDTLEPGVDPTTSTLKPLVVNISIVSGVESTTRPPCGNLSVLHELTRPLFLPEVSEQDRELLRQSEESCGTVLRCGACDAECLRRERIINLVCG